MKKLIMLIILLIIINIASISIAIENLTLTTDNQDININENFKIYVNIDNISVASYTLNIYFDDDKVEYISGPENTNVINNRIINIWYDESGGKNTKNNQEIAIFEFKAKEIGVASFYLDGEFFDSNGANISVNNTHIKTNIIEERNNTKINEIEGEDNNSLLKIMRLDKEGLIPEFSPDIKDYYFTTDLNTKSLEVTAIPQATNANIKITGNQSLREGLNKILIEVTSRDNSNTSTYTINVTKTNNIKSANTNLEILAIENITLEPLFDPNVLNYYASIPNEIKNLNIFAVPENIDGKIEIIRENELIEGNNTIIVKVTAPNGYTFKNYIINAYRRSIEEDKKIEEEQKINTEKLTTILEETKTANNKEKAEDNKEQKNNIYVYIIIMLIVFFLITIIFIIRKRKEKNNRK